MAWSWTYILSIYIRQWQIQSIGGSKKAARDKISKIISWQWRIYIVKFWTRAPQGSKFFQFHAVFGKIWQNRMLAPPGELAPPPQGNPGSATGWYTPLGLAPPPLGNPESDAAFVASLVNLPKGRFQLKKGAADPKLSVRFNDLKMLSSWVVNIPKNV